MGKRTKDLELEQMHSEKIKPLVHVAIANFKKGNGGKLEARGVKHKLNFKGSVGTPDDVVNYSVTITVESNKRREIPLAVLSDNLLIRK